MKKLLILLLFFSATLFASDKPQFVDATKPIIIKASHPNFSVRMKANPTTGYSWIYDAAHSSLLVVAIKEQYFAPVSELVGASGYDVWTFHVSPQAFTVPTKASVTLLYARPWQVNSAKKTLLTIVTTKS